MKTDLKDYVLCSFLLTLITIASVLVAMPILKLCMTWVPLGHYSVILGVVFFLLSYGIFSGFTLHLLIGLKPLQQGYSTMESPTFTYWKILIIISNFGQMAIAPFNFFFLGPVFARLYGAKIGKNSAVSITLADAFMVTIGDNAIIGSGTQICGNYLEGDKIFISPIRIGNNVTIGMNSVILPNTTIGDGATISIGSVVMPGTHIPAGEIWKGNPARKWQ